MPRFYKKYRRRAQTSPPQATVRPYARRKEWTDEQMLKAMDSVSKGQASTYQAAALHGVPLSTLKDRISGKVVHGKKPGPQPYLTALEEKELTDYLLKAAQAGYGKTRQQVKMIVEKITREKGMLKTDKISNGWWQRFLERNPSIRLRSGDSTGYERMDAVNKETIDSYFRLLKEVYDEFEFSKHPERVYNMDETGMPLNPRPPKVVARKGQKKVRYACSGQKGQITVLGCASATGHIVPPFIIFDGKQLNPLWTRGEVPGSRYGLSDSGWIDRELFDGWLIEHFLIHAPTGRPLLLLLDGHSSHFEPTTIRVAKENGVIIFCLPPHTTHEAQPLDVSLFGPLKAKWRDVCHRFYQDNPGRVVTKLSFSPLFAEAWMNAVTQQTVSSGFKKAGVWPFNAKAIAYPDPKEATATSSQTSTSLANPQPSSESLSLRAPSSSVLSPPDESSSLRTPSSESVSIQSHPGESSSVRAPSSESSRKHSFPGELSSVRTLSSESSSVQSHPGESSGVRVPAGETQSSSEFSAAQITRFETRLEEGYDSEYAAWLELNYPDKVPPHFRTQQSNTPSILDHFADVMPTETVHEVSGGISAINPPTAVLSTPTCTSSFVVSSTPASTSSTHNSTANTPSSLASQQSSLATSSSSTASPILDLNGRKASLVSKYCNLIPTPLRPRPKKTPRAKVLTSDECLAMLEEKEAKKKEEAQEKERRKEEREQKKTEREQKKREEAEKKEKRKQELAEKKRQKEEEARKKKEIAAKKRQDKLTSKACVQKSPAGAKRGNPSSNSSVAQTKPNESVAKSGECSRSKSPGVGTSDDRSQSPSLSSESPSGRKRPNDASAEGSRSYAGPSRSKRARYSENYHVDTDQCCVCFCSYDDDVSGSDWLECACGRWLHEDCVEECLVDTTGKERICPLCLCI